MLSHGQAIAPQALDTFAQNAALMARSVLIAADEVDRLRDAVYAAMVSFMQGERTTVNRAVALMFMAQNIERIADHATNIVEDVLFPVQGVDVRHQAETRGMGK